MIIRGIALAAIGLLALPATAQKGPGQRVQETIKNKPALEMVFALDTTGSMGGLLDGAKRTVWSIASHIREVDKNADVHVGLVAYRDLGDVYVTKDFALTSNVGTSPRLAGGASPTRKIIFFAPSRHAIL